MRTPVLADNLRDVRFDDLVRHLQERLDALGPAPLAEPFHARCLASWIGMTRSRLT